MKCRCGCGRDQAKHHAGYSRPCYLRLWRQSQDRNSRYYARIKLGRKERAR